MEKRTWRERYAGWEKDLHNGEDLSQAQRRTFALPDLGEATYRTWTAPHPPVPPVKRSTGLRLD